MAFEEARRILAEQTGLLVQKATEEALSDFFYCGTEEANTGFEKAPYFFVEGILTKMATLGSMDDMFERNLERWTQCISFMDAFT